MAHFWDLRALPCLWQTTSKILMMNHFYLLGFNLSHHQFWFEDLQFWHPNHLKNPELKATTNSHRQPWSANWVATTWAQTWPVSYLITTATGYGATDWHLHHHLAIPMVVNTTNSQFASRSNTSISHLSGSKHGKKPNLTMITTTSTWLRGTTTLKHGTPRPSGLHREASWTNSSSSRGTFVHGTSLKALQLCVAVLQIPSRSTYLIRISLLFWLFGMSFRSWLNTSDWHGTLSFPSTPSWWEPFVTGDPLTTNLWNSQWILASAIWYGVALNLASFGVNKDHSKSSWIPHYVTTHTILKHCFHRFNVWEALSLIEHSRTRKRIFWPAHWSGCVCGTSVKM